MNTQTLEYYPPGAVHAAEVFPMTDCGKCNTKASVGQYFPPRPSVAKLDA